MIGMDSTYAGAYGRLKVSKSDFVAPSFAEQIAQKEAGEFIKMLSTTSYRREVDALSQFYQMPDLVEVVLNAHLMRMVKMATFAIPPQARDFVLAYVSKWDINNINTVLSSKVLGYDVEHTEAFLTVQRTIPVGLFSGTISREDYAKIIEQKDIEGVVNALVRFGYGTTLLKFVDDAKKNKDISSMILALDIGYYSRLISTLKFYNGDEGPLMDFIRSLVDIKNIMTVIKSVEFGYKGAKNLLIKGGNMPEAKLTEMSGKGLDGMRGDMPFSIDDAFERYGRNPFLAEFEMALRRELYKKYIRIFESLPLSIESIMAFILRSEIERDELRAIWLGKYYNIGKERLDSMRMLKYVVQ